MVWPEFPPAQWLERAVGRQNCIDFIRVSRIILRVVLYTCYGFEVGLIVVLFAF